MSGKRNCSDEQNELKSLSTPDLEELLFNTAMSDSYDADYLDALLAEYSEREGSPKVDTMEAWSKFCRRAEQMPDTSGTVTERKKRTVVRKVLAAAAMFIVVLSSSMVIAQAVGVDIWGMFAHWTDTLFSFGSIRDNSAVDLYYDNASSAQETSECTSSEPSELAYTSLQEALDAYGITEVIAPTWMPDEYELEQIDVHSEASSGQYELYAKYVGRTENVKILISSYEDEPTAIYEKTDAPIMTIEYNGSILYAVENTNSNTVAWTTPQYECSITGALDKETLILIAKSMIPAER